MIPQTSRWENISILEHNFQKIQTHFSPCENKLLGSVFLFFNLNIRNYTVLLFHIWLDISALTLSLCIPSLTDYMRIPAKNSGSFTNT